MTIISTIHVPFSKIPDRFYDMYFRGKRFSYDQSGDVMIEKGGFIQTDTYYNSFSIKKWRRYTRMEDLYLCVKVKGRGRITVRNDFRVEYGISCHVLEQVEFDCKEKSEIGIDLSRYIGCTDMLSFDLIANEETTFYSAEYLCSAEPSNVNIALAVCTFKREDYVYTLINEYKRCLTKNISLFISDNGKTLIDPQTDGVHIFQNKNYGGAGGFARCMLEVKRYNKAAKIPISHMVLMDDDILLDFRILEKLISFLSILRGEYNNYFICGAMCNLDQPNIQYERNSKFSGGNNFLQYGANFDLREQYLCILNEEDDDLTYQMPRTAGWWFCCINVKIFHNNNYPFPCFFRGDDIEYAIRNGSKVITLNGLNVWHEPFYKKYSNVAENYYLPRNTMVINTLYNNSAVENTVRYFTERVKSCLIQYDYEGMELLNRAMEDFFQGPSFFAQQDAEALNKELSTYNHKMISFREALGEYDYSNIVWQVNECSDSSRFVRFIRKITLNGYLIPKFLYKDFRISGVGFRGRSYSYFRRRRVFNADTFSYKGYFTQIDKLRALKLYVKFRKNMHFFKKNFIELQRVYSLGFPDLQTEKFWINYLEIDSIE